jgi:hypothetical protein
VFSHASVKTQEPNMQNNGYGADIWGCMSTIPFISLKHVDAESGV